MVFSVDLIHLHAMALSEPLSLALGFGGLVMLGSWFEARRPSSFALPIAAAMTGLAALTRYAGVACTRCAGAAALLVIRWGPDRSGCGRQCCSSGSPHCRCCCRRCTIRKESGGPVNRQLLFHPFPPGLFRQGLETSLSWVVPKDLPTAPQVGPCCWNPACIRQIALRIRAAATGVDGPRMTRSNQCAIEWLLGLFVPCYLAVLLVSKAFLDFRDSH